MPVDGRGRDRAVDPFAVGEGDHLPLALDIAALSPRDDDRALPELDTPAVMMEDGDRVVELLVGSGYTVSGRYEDGDESLIQEVELATQLGLPFLVLHPGAHLGAGEAAGIKQIVGGLDQVFAATKKSPVRIALENTAGQGTYLGNKIEHLAAVFERVKKPERLGVCLDTAHLFAAGYDIRTPKGWDAAIREVVSLIGLKQILAFHLNDSKTDLGSCVDRHEHIGKGKIGKEAFRHIVNDERFKKHPGCLETPKSEDLHEDVRNLAVLRSLMSMG